MRELHDRATDAQAGSGPNGRALGWLSGLALLVVPWVAAGVLATVGTMVGPESWSAERSFPWLLLASLAGCLGWVGYGSLRISGFVRGALPGAAIALGLIGGIYVLGVVLG